MSNSFTTNIIISHLAEDTNMTTRLINQIISLVPKNYGSGIYTLDPEQLDYLLLNNKSFVFFKSSADIVYKIGADGEEFTGNMFLHNGEAIDLYISSTDEEDEITVEYVYMDRED
jgi:hypothetical protein